MSQGNKNWCKPELPTVVRTVTEFERTVSEFKLRPDEYATSTQLRLWVEQNRNSRYVPEYLLRAWKLEVVCAL